MSDEEIVVKIIAGLTIEVETKQEIICNLTAMNDELQAKVEKIKQVVSEWNKDASNSFGDMCKIKGILKE